MSEIYETNMTENKPWKKAMCVFLSVIIAFGTFVALTVGSSRLQDWLGIKSMLSAYAGEIVDTKGAAAVDEEAMLANNHVIDLKNTDGSNTVYLFSEPISFTDENGNLKTKDISVEKQTDNKIKNSGYEYTNGQNDYRLNFSTDSTKGLLAEFDDCAYSIIPISEISVEGSESKAALLNEEFEVFQYENIYGNGTNLRFYPQLNGVKDEIVLDQNIGKNAFSFELNTKNCTAVLNDDGTVSLLSDKDNSAVQTFSAPFAYDSKYVEGIKDSHYIDCKYSLEKKSETSYVLTVTVDNEWLNDENTVYPVIIDPTTSNISNYRDAGIYSSKSSNCYGKETTCCFGRASEYGYGRVLNQFTMPTDIKKGAKINSAYMWQRETTGRTSTTYVTPYMVKDAWAEGDVTWATRPMYYTSTGMTKRNINSKSSDDPDNSYWYKFNITSAVQKWTDGSYKNNGVIFVSSEETDKEYNWRAFTSKQYSSSAMRPYTVINYTNDTTAPTVTSVTGNPTSWTKNNVTLTVNGAADNSGGAGLHSTPYSFSTTKGSYSWQSSKSKTFTVNDTIYVYVRDALNNIRLVSTQNITKIDKTAPAAPTVTGNASSWTKDNVTLTASSTDSASGIAAYSFSTQAGTYSWQTGMTKSFSSNATVYVYAKDNAGNISAAKTITINKIDKTKPSAPVITGNNEEWNHDSITITANSTDADSGVSEYSFSNAEGTYNWSEKNSATYDKSETIYVYSKDAAGNISNVSTSIIKIDKLPPTDSVVKGNSQEWVNSVTLTVDNSQDEVSGLNPQAYSFSKVENEYEWQESNSKTITENGTVYVYVRDKADNILLVDTVVIDKIDRSRPIINDINVTTADGKTTMNVDASDSQSGVALYSFDDGQTWQTSNQYTFDSDTFNYLYVNVKDNAGNVSSKLYNFYEPGFYVDGGRIVVYNPNDKCESKIYYKASKSIKDKWQVYDEPFVPIGSEFYVSFIPHSSVVLGSNYKTYDVPENISVLPENQKESYTDATFTYKKVNLPFSRTYDNSKKQWDFSFNSYLKYNPDSHLYNIVLPSGENLMFATKKEDVFCDAYYQYEMNILRDDSGNITSYLLKNGSAYYVYNISGELVTVTNKYDDKISIERDKEKITVQDDAGRQFVVALDADGNVSTITDPQKGVIRYYYEDGKLIKVVDQAGAIIGEYQYSETGLLIKVNDKSISYTDDGRISEYLNDNGAYIKYEYTENSIKSISSDEKTEVYEYNQFGNIASYTDSYGDKTTYNYDSENKLISTEKNEKIIYKYGYDEFGNITDITDSDHNSNTYVYDSEGRIITEKVGEDFTHYFYDEDDNVSIKVTVDEEYKDIYFSFEYDENFEHYVKIFYTYDSSNLLVSEETPSKNIKIQYTYDIYGNNVKTTTTQTDGEETKVSVCENTYNLLGQLLTVKSDDSETIYTYDAAGRTLLTETDGKYKRTVYDSYGRVIQEIDNSDYNPDLDNLPNAYSDNSVGQRYYYDAVGNLVKSINNNDIETDYTYSEKGNLYSKSFDIYDFFYNENGSCNKINVNDVTIVSCQYKVNDSDKTVEDGQYINRITYANGYVEEQKVDKYNNVYSKFADGNLYFSITSATENGCTYYENESNYRNTISSKDNSFEYDLKNSNNFHDVFCYSVDSNNETKTITEQHFNGKEFQTIINEDKISFAAPNSSFVYNVDGDENSATAKISSESSVLLSSEVSYNESDNILKKSYYNGLLFQNKYDDEGNIVSDGNNEYSYNDIGELVSSKGNINSFYSYDTRGNMLSKEVNGEKTLYSYENNKWQDQLTAVNDVELKYDLNGNLTEYGDVKFTWTHGKWLSTVDDGENTYSYKYNSTGIRTSKTINDKTTFFNTLNGKILAQYDSNYLDSTQVENTIYFQYNNDTPVGFVLNDVQYFYLTNLNGDVVGITDNNGSLIAEYTYDEWGKLLSITTAEENNEEQLFVAEKNPLRYRGYYYDNETGMYYLQSRYYDPELCRFISADGFENLDVSSKFGLNTYIYCWNCPIAFEDAEGTTPQLAINLNDIVSLLETIDESINDGNIDLNAIIDKFSQLTDNWINSLKVRYNSFIDKLEYYLNYPDVFISEALSKLFNTDISIRFGIVDFIREYLGISINLSKYKVSVDNENNSAPFKAKANKNSDDSNNMAQAIFQGLFGGIILKFFCDVFDAMKIDLEDIMNESIIEGWFDIFEELIYTGIAIFSAGSSFLTGLFDDINILENGFTGIFKKLNKSAEKNNFDTLGKGPAFLGGISIISSFIKFSESIDNAGKGQLSKNGDIALASINLVLDVMTIFLPINPLFSFFISMSGDIIPKVITIRIEGKVLC